MEKANICATWLVLALAGTFAAADDPFVGKWKLNPNKGKTSGQHMKIEDLGNNKYAFSAAIPYQIVADGNDQPAETGGTHSLKIIDSNTWKFVNKKDGAVTSEDTLTLSPDGKALSSHSIVTEVSGAKHESGTSWKRVIGSGGFAGDWESTGFQMASSEVEFQPLAGGISFVYAANKQRIDLKFDGHDYPWQGPRTDPSMMSSGKRVKPDVIEILDKHNGKVVYTEEFKVSSDGKTLTLSSKGASQSTPEIVVFEKQ
jgi:hypothetical protein